MHFEKHNNKSNEGLISTLSKFYKYSEINPMLAAANCNIPALFIHGKNDRMINISHSLNLISVYDGGIKKLLEIDDCDHNNARPPWVFKVVDEYMSSYLIPASQSKLNSEKKNQVGS